MVLYSVSVLICYPNCGAIATTYPGHLYGTEKMWAYMSYRKDTETNVIEVSAVPVRVCVSVITMTVPVQVSFSCISQHDAQLPLTGVFR